MNKKVMVVFECPDPEINPVCPWETMNPFLDEIRKLGEERGIKIPKRIPYGGNGTKSVWIECSKKVAEIVVEVVESKNKKVIDLY